MPRLSSIKASFGWPLLGSLALLVFPLLSPAQELEKDTRPPLAPDIREDETELKLQRLCA